MADSQAPPAGPFLAPTDKHDSQKLLYAMGRETANVHCGDAKACAAIAADLPKRGKKWLAAAARAMADDATTDWNEWKRPTATASS